MMAVEQKSVKRAWLRKYRLQNDFTATQVAEKCGISRGHYSMIENGLKNPSMKLAVNLGMVLGFDPVFFMNERRDEYESTTV